jgi:osmoprotectant transport system permease protein
VWLFSINPSGAKVLEITPIDTGIPLIFLTLFLPIVEIMTKAILRERADDLVLPIVRVIGIFFFFWSIYGHEPLWDYVLANLFPTSAQLVHPNATVIEFTAQHLELVFVSSLITVPMGLLIGVMVTRDSFREILPLVNNLVNSGQTVPTIAIVAFMAPIIGFGFWPAIIALVAYGLLPVVRNTIAGLEAVDDFVIDSARGMGMTPAQILFRIELPIASSIIMAGIRTSMVINVGTATLGAFVGSGGLGTPIASGLSMTIDSFILLGAIPAALLAILIDYVLGRIEFVITPRGLQIEK